MVDVICPPLSISSIVVSLWLAGCPAKSTLIGWREYYGGGGVGVDRHLCGAQQTRAFDPMLFQYWPTANIETTLGRVFVFAWRAVRILIHACRLCLVGTGCTVLCVRWSEYSHSWPQRRRHGLVQTWNKGVTLALPPPPEYSHSWPQRRRHGLVQTWNKGVTLALPPPWIQPFMASEKTSWLGTDVKQRGYIGITPPPPWIQPFMASEKTSWLGTDVKQRGYIGITPPPPLNTAIHGLREDVMAWYRRETKGLHWHYPPPPPAVDSYYFQPKVWKIPDRYNGVVTNGQRIRCSRRNVGDSIKLLNILFTWAIEVLDITVQRKIPCF